MRRRRSGLNFGRQKKKVNMSVVKEVCVWIIEIAITLLVAFTLVYFVGLRTSVVGQSMAAMRSWSTVLYTKLPIPGRTM